MNYYKANDFSIEEFIEANISHGGEFLDISGLNLLEIPDVIKNYKTLSWLDMSHNLISSIPDWLIELEHLYFIGLSSNNLRELPLKLFMMNSLLRLDIDDNKISKVKFWGLQNKSLEILNLSNNKLYTIPENIREFTALRQLNISSAILYSVPSWINELYNLQSIDFSRNNLKVFPDIKNLTNLEGLDMSSNKLTEIPTWLSLLSELKKLGLNRNKLSELPKGFSKLNMLRKIGLSYNLFTKVPNELSGIVNLEELYLHNNRIQEIPLWLANLNSLRVLDLAGNSIEKVPKFLFEIENISEIMVEGTASKSNRILNLSGNPLENPPVGIIKQGYAAILRYFEDLEKEGQDQIYEAKLLLIGEGGAGKTSLCRKLFDPNAPLPQEKDRTKGIDIHPLYFELPNQEGKQFRLNIWDFAGQGKYQSAHSSFYTHRSLYILVDDTRTLNENDAWRTLYNNWLQTAELFGGQSPVLVLHNEKDGCARTGFSLGSFQEQFSFVHGELFRINLGASEAKKITDLRRQVERQALSLPHIGDTVPKTWVKVREAIETERQQHPYISAERYRGLCEDAGISDPVRQSDLSRYFHDLGVFLHFQDNPLLKRDVFLQNQWVIDAVYKILDDAQIAGEQRGRFNKSDLDRLWYESTYHDRRDELLALMLQFELCYQVQDTETYICPQLLPGDLPTYDLGENIPLQLKFEYVFMPKGLLYRLIVRLHRHIAQGQTAVWNSGVVLERMGAQADIIESLDRRTISVRATGLRAKELVTIINEEVERLHTPFGARLKVTVKIPCNCRICKSSLTPHFYDKTDLDTRMMKRKETVECSVSYDDVPVLGLLEGVFAKNTPRQEDKLKLFISYSKHDQHHKDNLLKHLSVLRDKIITWHDLDILPGEDWDESIKNALHVADVVLYLVTHNSLATDYIQQVELPLIEQRRAAGECVLVPVIVNFCRWKESYFAKYNCLPKKGLPVSHKTWTNEDEAWDEVVKGVKKILTARAGF